MDEHTAAAPRREGDHGTEPNLGAAGGVDPAEARQTDGESAFESFVSERWPRLVGTVIVIVQDRALAEDIVQETFARAYLNWPKLWPDGNPGGWTHRVATNLAISWRRRASRELRAIGRLGRQQDHAPEPEVVPELAPAIKRLPPRQRAAVAWHYVAGLTVDETAAAMRCRPGTVKSLLHDARANLRDDLGGGSS